MEAAVEAVRVNRIPASRHGRAGEPDRGSCAADRRTVRKTACVGDATHDRAEKKMEKFDHRLEATRKLVEAGMKILVRMNSRIDVLSADVKGLNVSVRELQKS
jgi:hypothetical protein